MSGTDKILSFKFEILKYCPSCKNDLSITNEILFNCSKCGFHLYINPSPCVSLVTFNNNDQLLLIKRKLDPHKGMYGLPGGFLEKNETFEQALVREIKEELNTNLSEIEYLASMFDEYLYKGINYSTICNIYKAKLDSYDLRAQDDIEEILFFDKNSIPFDKIAFTSQEQFLKSYLRIL